MIISYYSLQSLKKQTNKQKKNHQNQTAKRTTHTEWGLRPFEVNCKVPTYFSRTKYLRNSMLKYAALSTLK